MFHGVLVVEAVASTEVAARSEVLKFQQEKSGRAGNTTTNLIHNCPPHDAPIPKKRKARIKTESRTFSLFETIVMIGQIN